MRRLFARIYLHFLGVLLVVAVAASRVFAFTARSAFVQDSAWRTSRHAGRLVGEVFHNPSELARHVKQLHDELDLDLVVRPEERSSPPQGRAARFHRRGARPGRRRAIVHPSPAWSTAGPVREPGTGVVIGTVVSAAQRRRRARLRPPRS